MTKISLKSAFGKTLRLMIGSSPGLNSRSRSPDHSGVSLRQLLVNSAGMTRARLLGGGSLGELASAAIVDPFDVGRPRPVGLDFVCARPALAKCNDWPTAVADIHRSHSAILAVRMFY